MRLRPFEDRDLNSLLAVSLATGLVGSDAAHLYEDGQLMGLIYSAPYARLEPGLALVVEDAGGVCGFAVGATDTEAWEMRLEQEWWPDLRTVYPKPTGPPANWTADQRRSQMIHAPSRTPEAVTKRFPAHMHLNLLPRLQGQGVGSVLLNKWLTLAQQKGVKAVHVGVNYENERALRFWARSRFQPIDAITTSSRTIWMGRPEASA